MVRAHSAKPRRTQDGSAADSSPPLIANPRHPSAWLLGISIVLEAVWLVLLLWLALGAG